MQRKKTNYSYRFLFISETIGSLAYIKKNLNLFKKKFTRWLCFVVCRKWKKNKYYFKIQRKLFLQFFERLFKKKIKFNDLKWDKRGSDERQFSSPNVNLRFVCITKKIYRI